MDFYVLRDIEPERFYPRRSDGILLLYNDQPKIFWKNIDHTDIPFLPSKTPFLSPKERNDILEFLRTIVDR